MHWTAIAGVYVLFIFLAVYLLYVYGSDRPSQSMEQDELDAQMIRDPAQRIPNREWIQVLGVLILFIIALWAIRQYYADLLFAIREYMNL